MFYKHKRFKVGAVFIAAPLLWLTLQGANSSPSHIEENTGEVSSSEKPTPSSFKAKSSQNERLTTPVLKSGVDIEPTPTTNPLPTEEIGDVGSSDQVDQLDAWLASPNNTTVTPSELEHLDGSENRKPEINQQVYQALSESISEWTLVAGVPIDYTLSINELFDDPENDLLSIKVSLTLSGVTPLLSSNLKLKGTPQPSELPPVLTISAKDSYHGDEESAWTTATFDLPSFEAVLIGSHPLEGNIIYRLESSQSFQNQHTIYEVVYCEAFKFAGQDAFYAKANNRTTCPEEQHLNRIGSYMVEGDKLILSSDQSAFHAEQTWTVNRQYSSKTLADVTNYLVKIESGRDVESYTMQKVKSAMERRIQQVTGEYVYQFRWHDYLLPSGQGDYLTVRVSNYIFNRGSEYNGPNDELFDSDLNIQAYDQSLSCSMLAHYYQFDVVAGQGEYGIEIISSNSPTNPAYSVECIEYQSDAATGQISLAFNSDYSIYDEFVEGEVYSYILRPKPQYAGTVEELKLNMIYRQPNQAKGAITYCPSMLRSSTTLEDQC